MDTYVKTKILPFPAEKGASLSRVPNLIPKLMKKYKQNLPKSINFNSRFFIEFFSDSCNRDILLRLINSILIDMYYLPLTKLVKNPWQEGGVDETGELISGLAAGGITTNNEYVQVVIHPLENSLNPDFASNFYGYSYEFFKELAPKKYKKKSLHYVFLLNHIFIDPLDKNGLLKKDFHIISTAPEEFIATHFAAGNLVVHFIQLPRLLTNRIKSSFFDLILFLSIFISVSLENKPDQETQDYFYKVDPDMRRVWEAYVLYMSKNNS